MWLKQKQRKQNLTVPHPLYIGERNQEGEAIQSAEELPATRTWWDVSQLEPRTRHQHAGGGQGARLVDAH